MGKKTGDAALATALDYRARDPQDADRGQRLARLLHLARGRHLSARRPSDADRGRAGGDDRECRPHGRHAGRPAVAQRRGRGRSRLEDREGDRGRSRRRRRSTRGRRRCSRRWSRSAAGSAARTARASTTIRRAARRRLWPGLAELQPKKLDPDTIDVEELKHRLLAHPGAGDRALLRGGRAHRRARGRCRLDPRLRLRAVLRRHAVLHRHDGREALRRAVPAPGEEIRRALRAATSCCSTWRKTARASTAASRRGKKAA